jgi:hypothetical protein
MAANTDDQENHWPGYVDALTTMTMVLTFIMMVLGISIFTLSQNVSRGVIEKIAAAARVQTLPETPGKDDLAERIVARIETLQQTHAGHAPTPSGEKAVLQDAPEHPRVHSQAEAMAEVRSAPVRLDADEGLLRIVFKSRSTQLDDAAREQLVARLGAISGLISASRVDVLAGVDPSVIAVSDAKRVAFYRAMRARSELIQQGVAADRIHVRLDNTTSGDDVLIRVRP